MLELESKKISYENFCEFTRVEQTMWLEKVIEA
jgi:hypothetical protein